MKKKLMLIGMRESRGHVERNPGPSIVSIARYWCGQAVFDIDWDTPMCFACRRLGAGNDDFVTPKGAWSHSGLERCHLIPHSEGGRNVVKNLALLCVRCHREAPMVGVSAEPMIEWIRRREDHVLWFFRRLTAECDGIKPGLLEECASLGLSGDECHAALASIQRYLRIGFHPRGNPVASAAQIVAGVVEFHQQFQAALRIREAKRVKPSDYKV